MTLLSIIRARRAVFMVLLAWLFAVGSVVANACVVGLDGSHGQGVETAAGVQHHAAATADRDVGAQLAAASCFEACGDSSQAVVPQEREVAPIDQCAAPPVAWAWPPMPVASGPTLVRVVPAGPPRRVAYSRLAL